MARFPFIVAVAIAASSAHAQPFPSKALRIIVPFTAGGVAYLSSNLLAEHVKKSFPAGVIVDNRPSAGGTVGYEAGARAPGDGHTITVVFPSLLINPLLREVKYNPLKDFKAVTQTASFPIVIAVHPSVPVRSLKELIALAQAQPGEISYGTSGVGTLQHILGEKIGRTLNARMLHVPSPTRLPTIDVAGGHVVAVFASLTEIAGLADARKVRPIAVSTPRRAEALSAVPTFRESGFAHLEMTNWCGLAAPAATSDAAISRLNTEIVRTLSIPDVQERFKAQGIWAAPSTPSEFAAFLASESGHYARVLGEAGIRLE
jgi:tripartite-type tricarboxylate transporter receptor subunit TctC